MAELFDYGQARSDAQAIIAEFGQTMTIQKPDGSAKQTFTGVLLGLSYKDSQGTLLPDCTGKVLTSTDLKRSADDDGDRIIINKVTYIVISTEALRPAGTDVLFTMYVRS